MTTNELLMCFGIGAIFALVVVYFILKYVSKTEDEENPRQFQLMHFCDSFEDLREFQLRRISQMINIYDDPDLDFDNPDSWFYEPMTMETCRDHIKHQFKLIVSEYERALIANYREALGYNTIGKVSVPLCIIEAGSNHHTQTFDCYNIKSYILYHLPEKLMELEYAYFERNKKQSEIPNLPWLIIYQALRDKTKDARVLY